MELIPLFIAAIGAGGFFGGWCGYRMGVDNGRFMQRLDWANRKP